MSLPEDGGAGSPGYALHGNPLYGVPFTPFATGELLTVVVGMGCGDEGCPLVPARRHEEWGVPDPRTCRPSSTARCAT